MWSVEHGSFRDDEVNLLVSGGDYGWNPVPGYNEEVPMTDPDLPGEQVEAAWSSGDPTVAPGGATFVSGSQWGDLEGVLAMAVLKDQEVLFLSFDADGALEQVRRPEELADLGRVRTVVSDTDGTLLVTTDNGGGRDELYRVRRAEPRLRLQLAGQELRPPEAEGPVLPLGRDDGDDQVLGAHPGVALEAPGHPDPGQPAVATTPSSAYDVSRPFFGTTRTV